jgi:hypothetical protein
MTSMTSDSPVPQPQIPNSRLGSVASDAANSQKGSRPGSPSSDAPSAQHLQRSRPGSSSSEGPLGQQRSSSTTLPQAASIPSKPTTKLKPKIDSLGLGRGRPSVRASSSSIGITKSATRGGSNLGPKNVFAAREPPKQRPNLLQNAANSSKDPKTFANMHLRRKAELQAREVRGLKFNLALSSHLGRYAVTSFLRYSAKLFYRKPMQHRIFQHSQAGCSILRIRLHSSQLDLRLYERHLLLLLIDPNRSPTKLQTMMIRGKLQIKIIEQQTVPKQRQPQHLLIHA